MKFKYSDSGHAKVLFTDFADKNCSLQDSGTANVPTIWFGRNQERMALTQAQVVRKTRALYADMAVLHCVNHMQQNSYAADSAEIYDIDTAELHAQITRNKADTVTIVYKRNNDTMRRSWHALIGVV